MAASRLLLPLFGIALDEVKEVSNMDNYNFYEKMFSNHSEKLSYIHQHWENIGKLNNPPKSIQDKLGELYDQKKSKVVQQAQNDYYQLFMKDAGRQKLFLEACNLTPWRSREDILHALDNNIQESLEKQINPELAQQLFEKGQKVSKSIQQLAQASTKKKVIEQADAILEIIIKSLQLVNETSELGEILSEVYERYSTGAGRLNQLATIIAKEKNNPESKYVTNKAMKKAMEYIDTFLNIVQDKVNNRNIVLDSKGLNSLICKNLFSRTLGELVAWQAEEGAQTTLEKGWSAQSSFFSSGYSRPIVGKADMTLNNLQVSMIGNKNLSKAIEIKVGISEKFYLSAAWKGSSQPISIESGSGGRLGPTLAAIYNQQEERYYARNILAHSGVNKSLLKANDPLNTNFEKNIEEANKKISALICARQILRVFSTTIMGNDISNQTNVDFAGYIYANGHLISIRKIMNYLFDLLYKDAIRRSSFSMRSDAITFSIPDQKDWKPSEGVVTREGVDSLYRTALLRSFAISKAMNNALVYSTIHIHKIINFLK